MKKKYCITWDKGDDYPDKYDVYLTFDALKEFIKKVKDKNPEYVVLKVEEVIEIRKDILWY